MRTNRSVTQWIVGAALVAAAVLFVLRGREPADVLSLSAPSVLPVPGGSVEALPDLLRSPGDPRAVGDPRAGDAVSTEAPADKVDR